jgi:hypothetical protein
MREAAGCKHLYFHKRSDPGVELRFRVTSLGGTSQALRIRGAVEYTLSRGKKSAKDNEWVSVRSVKSQVRENRLRIFFPSATVPPNFFKLITQTQGAQIQISPLAEFVAHYFSHSKV